MITSRADHYSGAFADALKQITGSLVRFTLSNAGAGPGDVCGSPDGGAVLPVPLIPVRASAIIMVDAGWERDAD